MDKKAWLICLVALTSILFSAAPLMSQARLTGAETGDAANARTESLIDRLEIGMSALEEIGREDLLRSMRELTKELRAGRAQESDEVRTVRKRLKVMRTAVDAFLEVGRDDAAELVEHAMHARELNLARRRDDEANRIRESAPDRAQLSEALGAAAGLYREWKMPDRAQALAELSEVYHKQWQRRQNALRSGRVTELEQEARESDVHPSVDTLEERLDILRFTRDAFAEAGDERNTKVLNGVIHFGELALGGANDEQLREALADVPSLGNLAEYTAWAARKYREWGNTDRATACHRLSQYYAARHRKEGHEVEAEKREELERAADLERRAADERRAEHQRARAIEADRRRAEELQRRERNTESGRPRGELTDRELNGLRERIEKAIESGSITREQAHERMQAYIEQRQAEAHREREERERSRESSGDIQELSRRIEILKTAYAAFRRSQREEAAHTMERFIRLAELQRSGADAEAMSQAAEGLSMGTTIELLQQASKIYAEWGMEDRAHVCNELAEFYAARERERRRESEAGRRATEERPSHSDNELEEVRAQLQQVLRRIEAMQEELHVMRETIHSILDR